MSDTPDLDKATGFGAIVDDFRGVLNDIQRNYLVAECGRRIAEAVKAATCALRAELEVRTEVYANAFQRDKPEGFNGRATSCAWGAGYELAWRGKAYKNSYLRSHQQRAFQCGYESGEADSRRKIAAAIRARGETKP